eukprot:CAMPEP_0172838152 /NCGR_PEP_ID=MMETSP1075-20121228/27673_1 /TAXON_ID=2916 /ORGANISM="Ceratium fusus, Strain PA161109" /LENGTH=256 /DNA_ID=CAMNT_0013681623 /DNA_START=43 /DNA_END=810 /DNA_ORIENTATION=-
MAAMSSPGACLTTWCVFLMFSLGCSGNTKPKRRSLLSKAATARNSELHLDGVGATAKIEVYYEALCPDSIEFIDKSLRVAWEDTELRGRMSLHLIPFGNGQLIKEDTVSKGYHFWHPGAGYPLVMCQHGSQECLGNKIQACAIADLEETVYVPFLLCMIAYGTRAGPELSSYDCGQRLGIDMAKVKDCASSRRGHELLLGYGQRSLDPQLGRKYVPFIMVDGRHSDAAEKGDFIGALCGALGAPKPAACSKVSAQG